MLHYSWDMVHDGCNKFSFWANFCSFTALTARKIKVFEKWKKHLEISSFYTSIPKIMVICYTVPEIWCVTDVLVVFHLGYFLSFKPLPTAEKIKIKKVPGDIIILYMCTKNYDQMRYGSWNMMRDRRTDRRTEKRHIEVGSHLKSKCWYFHSVVSCGIAKGC